MPPSSNGNISAIDDQPNAAWRGLCVYRAPLEEARRLAESDPSVRRGRLSVVAFRWYTRKGALVMSANDAGQSV